MSSRHRHRVTETRTYGYSGPVSGADYEPRAHGAVRHVDRCSCGALRVTNSNGLYQEQGPWYVPEEDA